MTWRGLALSGGAIAIAALVWVFSPVLLERIGLADFDPLDRICLVFLLLSVAEKMAARWSGH
jgi:hypothetical protein